MFWLNINHTKDIPHVLKSREQLMEYLKNKSLDKNEIRIHFGKYRFDLPYKMRLQSAVKEQKMYLQVNVSLSGNYRQRNRKDD